MKGFKASSRSINLHNIMFYRPDNCPYLGGTVLLFSLKSTRIVIVNSSENSSAVELSKLNMALCLHIDIHNFPQICYVLT